MTWFVLVESNTTGTGRLFCAAARQLGLRPVLFARDPGRYPYVADDGVDFRTVDTTDLSSILAAATALDGGVGGVTSSSEYFIGTAAEVARVLGLPHPDPDAIRACRDKHSQRATLRDAAVACPEFADARTPDEAADVAEKLGFPVVVKPVAGSGSIGVRRCDDADEARAAAAAILDVDPADLALPPQGRVVVEQYLHGEEFSVETLDETVVGVTRKYLGPEPYFVEIGHDFPASLRPEQRTALGDTAVAALRALGLGWGAAHVELRLTPSGPAVIEVNPRLAGGMLPRVIEEATGVSMIAYQVAKPAGVAAAPRRTREAYASIRFLLAPHGGWLAGVAGLDAARAVPGVVEVALTRAPGQEIVLRNSFQDRLGYVIGSGGTGSVAAGAADAGLRALEVRIEPTSTATEGSLS